MADFTIETKDLDIFKNELDDLQRKFPQEAKKLMLRSGNKARAIIVKKAKQLVNRKTGNYLKSIKRGKAWVDDSTGEYKIRAYTRAPHGHLIEKGHRIVTKEGKEVGFVQGLHVFDRAEKEIEAQWEKIVEKEFEKILSKL